MKIDTALLKTTVFDLLVIGGGINGAAIAHLASLHGMKVALLEKGDFASGTSSKSTKLIHGGIRYLEQFEFDLVSEALKERAVLLKAVPHLVRPLPFIIPIYRGDARPLWKMRLGVWLYDILAGSRGIGAHAFLSPGQVLAKAPSLKNEELLGGVEFWDAQMDDARLVLENVLAAAAAGAQVSNYCAVQEFIYEGQQATGVKARNVLTGEEFTVRARQIICAGGPWSNQLLKMVSSQEEVRVRTTKGAHLIYRGRLASEALLVTARQDGRVFFVIPWGENSLIGTTDTDYAGSADDVKVSEDDVNYLLSQAQRYFPKAPLLKEHIITMFAGLRPLVNKSGKPSSLSRKHELVVDPSGVVFVLGGKYTTYRVVAQDAVRTALGKRLLFKNQDYALVGSGAIPETVAESAQTFGVSEPTIVYLRELYGTRTRQVLSLLREDASLKLPLCDCSLAIRAQVVYALKQELAQVPEDIYTRRLGLNYLLCLSQRCRVEIENICQQFTERP